MCSGGWGEGNEVWVLDVLLEFTMSIMSLSFQIPAAAHGGGWVGSLVLLIVTEKKNKSD